jgi:uncharacterized protein with FMN-binding domain
MGEALKTNNALKGNRRVAIKIITGVIIVSLAVGIYFAANYVYQLSEYKKRIADISISNINLSKIPDGSYTGSYDAIMIAAKVQVTISDHTIKDVKILYHKNERGKKAEVIVNEIKSAQSLKVDTITGATNSSKVILKAVQNALQSGVKD